jgi:hypothetical protein
MSELSYTQTFNELMQPPQKEEFHWLLQKGKRLLDTAHREHTLPKISQNPHLKRFVDMPNHVQAFWEIEKNDVTYPRDRLAINMARGALWISLSYSDPQPDRSLTIGDWYANLNEQSPLHAHLIDQKLRNDRDENYYYNPTYVTEQLARFAVHLDNTIELMGLSYAVSQPGEAEETTEDIHEAQAA